MSFVLNNHRNAILLIRASLWFSVGLCGLIAVIFLAVAPIAGVFYGVLTVCLVCYTRAVQGRIPYAASNLKCAVTVLKTNLGLGLIALVSMLGLMGYSFSWVLAFAGTMQLNAMTESSSATSEDSSDLSAIGGIVGFLFLLSFYWTHQVMKNVVRVTVSGVVGTWWFSPAEAASLCSDAVRHSLIRSTTSSFGSICFGSLIVAILHILRNALHSAQNNRNAGVLRCIAMCILSYIERLVEYFNKWGYVYIGLYGYSFWEAGPKVLQLFASRGWTTLINDQLIYRVMILMSLVMGLLNGVLAAVVVLLFPSFLKFEDDGDSQVNIWIAFWVGTFIGTMLSHVLMSVVTSAVDTVLVCFAEAPMEFRQNHPEHFQRMDQAWLDTFPNEYHVVAVDSLP